MKHATDAQAKRNYRKWKREHKANKVDNQWSPEAVAKRYGAFSIAARLAAKGVFQ
jgi:hypothetical protein